MTNSNPQSQPNTTPIKDIEDLIEKLADIEHQRWSDWQSWVHTLYRDNREMFDTYIERWEKQIATPYNELSEREKQSDRDQVNRYLPILQTYIDNKILEADSMNEIALKVARHGEVTFIHNGNTYHIKELKSNQSKGNDNG